MIHDLKQISDYIWELPRSYKKDMKVPVRIYASRKLVEDMEESVFEQSADCASLFGLVSHVAIMPDAHSGYGAPIGAVFASDPEIEGVISPGAVGYDINCGMRLLSTNLSFSQIKPYIEKLIISMYESIPAGLGRQGLFKISFHELDRVLEGGAKYIIEKGFGNKRDIEQIEEEGCLETADSTCVSKRAKERGKKQLMTLGSGNHYLELQRVKKIYNTQIARKLGITEENQITVMVHTGSRGLGHQVAIDYLREFDNKKGKYKIEVVNKQLVSLPFKSEEGQRYFRAMSASSNFAFANRQLITHKIRESFNKIFKNKFEDIGLDLVYDVAHNIAKLENHDHSSNKLNKSKKLLVHRKGATRSFPNKPVIIGGSMETGSFLLMGTKKALKLSFGSTAHGSGRVMSRKQAKKHASGKDIVRKMKNNDIYVKSPSISSLAEEAGFAYKDINEVVESIYLCGLANKIASFAPIGNIKG